MYEENAGATQVFNADDPLMGVEWSVNVSDDDTRTMRAPDIAFEYLRGGLDPNDTFVWRDGMGDWIPLGQCQELLDVIRQYEGGQHQGGQMAASPQPAGVSEGGYDPEDEDEFGSTVMMDANSQEMLDAQAQAAASSQGGFGSPVLGNPAPDEVSQTMASPYDAPEEEDPFADARPPEAAEAPPGPKRVGQRNEASALFSLDQIRAQAEAEAGGKQDDDPFGDIMSLGGGGIAGAFAPPPINAPAPPPPPPKPEPKPVQAAAPPAAASMPPPAAMASVPAPQQKSRKGLIIGAVLGVLVIGGGVAAFALSGSDSTEEPTAKNDATGSDGDGSDAKSSDETSSDDKSPEDEGELAKNEDDEDEGDKDEEDKDEDEKDEDKDEDDKDETKTAKADSDGKSPVSTTTSTTSKSNDDDKKDDDKKTASTSKDDDKKEEEKKTAKAEFNRDAARSALAGAAGAASGCRKPGGPTGKGRVTVTFAPSGRATQATVGPPFAGTAVGSCAAGAFRGASVPPFTGGPVTVSKSFFIK
jgi:hypothetical protein